MDNKFNNRNHILTLLAFLLLVTSTMSAKLIDSQPIVTLLGRQFHCYLTTEKESLYAISRKLDVNYDSLLLWNQGIDGEVKKGHPIYYPVQDVVSQVNQIPTVPERKITYRVKYGDTLSQLAQTFHTSVESILDLNPGLSPANLKAGSDIYILENSSEKEKVAVTEMIPAVTAFKFYIARKGDSWEGIARTNNIESALLIAANSPLEDLKKGRPLAIPIVGEVAQMKYIYQKDHRENTATGVQAIFDSIQQERVPDVLYAAVILATPATNKDVDFSRGFLTALREFGYNNKKIDVSFIDGNCSNNELLNNETLERASIIFTTYDKEIPAELADYALKNDRKIVNAFAVKDSLHMTNPAVINLLSSASEFNNIIVQEIVNSMSDRHFVFLGDPLKDHDPIALEIMNRLPTDNFDVIESPTEYVPDLITPTVFYSLANKKTEIKEDLNKIIAWKEAHPSSEFITMGRPAWIVQSDALMEQLQNANAYIPSRFYFSEKHPASQSFIKKYHDTFKANPIRSYPAYSVMGYDVAWSFLRPDTVPPQLQMPFRLQRITNGGQFNSSAYMLRFIPGLPVSKVDIINPMENTETPAETLQE